MLKDTIGNFVFDSIINDMGTVAPEIVRLTKYFKYIGTDSIRIERGFTGDPHLICDYPKGFLTKETVYPFTVCFYHRYRPGYFHKSMGFVFSNGQRVTLSFKGFVEEE